VEQGGFEDPLIVGSQFNMIYTQSADLQRARLVQVLRGCLVFTV